jgi:hypothetical protein
MTCICLARAKLCGVDIINYVNTHLFRMLEELLIHSALVCCSAVYTPLSEPLASFKLTFSMAEGHPMYMANEV